MLRESGRDSKYFSPHTRSGQPGCRKGECAADSGSTDVGDKFELSEDYKLLAVTPEEFGGVIKERIARLVS
jgi:hypothetical protein